MTKLPSGGAYAPTPFSELNAVLARMLDGQRRLIGDNLVGVWLQGSFALGDADASSDCDWIALLRRDLTPAEASELSAFHKTLADSGTPWSDRLEGSYAPVDVFRRQSSEPRDPPGEPRGAGWADPGTGGSPPKWYPFWFLGNGEQTLVRSEHDNSQVVRWVTREHGVTLFGPPPADLIDPVFGDALRAEARGLLRRVVGEWTASPAKMSQVWLQGFFVTLVCRLLHTLQTGEVQSKPAAHAWALANLEPRWTPLIERAAADRLLPMEAKLGPADRALVAETLALMRHALRLDAKLAEQRLRAERGALHGAQRGQHQAPPPRWGGPAVHRGVGPAPVRPGGRGRRG